MLNENGANARAGSWLKAGIIAGLVGGLAEVVFMAIYGFATGLEGTRILSLITLTFSDRAIAFGQFGAVTGLMIHFALSILVGLGFGILMYTLKRNRATADYVIVGPIGAVMLIGIWAFNFFVLLPSINSEFVAYVPIKAAFVSKLSFGVSLGIFGRTLSAFARRSAASLTEGFVAGK